MGGNRNSGKEFLDEIREINSLIQSLKEQIAIEESRLTDTAVHYKEIQVQSSGSRNMMEEKIPKIADLTSQLEEHIRKLTAKQDLAWAIIRELRPRMQTVMLRYYIQGKTLEQIAEEMGKSYRWAWSVKREAVEKFSNIFEKIENVVD
ncbi:MAG: hypothetical protein NC123_15615 [Butyrivibrio sp.]|nr:hypothetical protein [Acetatifactor muris]MCM1560947.1 hypothetical protein [Butyrivibrio sp.]